MMEEGTDITDGSDATVSAADFQAHSGAGANVVVSKDTITRTSFRKPGDEDGYHDPDPNVSVIGQRRVATGVLIQLFAVTVIMLITWGASFKRRDAFHWKSAQIATVVLVAWFWFLLFIGDKVSVLSWILLSCWTALLGITTGFLAVSTESEVPLFFMGILTASIFCMWLISYWNPFSFEYTIAWRVQLFITSVAWLVWWLVHQASLRSLAEYASLALLSIVLSMWTLRAIYQAGDVGNNKVEARNAILGVYTGCVYLFGYWICCMCFSRRNTRILSNGKTVPGSKCCCCYRYTLGLWSTPWQADDDEHKTKKVHGTVFRDSDTDDRIAHDLRQERDGPLSMQTPIGSYTIMDDSQAKPYRGRRRDSDEEEEEEED